VCPLAFSCPSVKGCQRGVFVEHSSTNTKRSGSIEDITITRKAALRNSSRSLAPRASFFSAKEPIERSARERVDSLTETPATLCSYSRLSESLARTDAPPRRAPPGASWPAHRVWVFCLEPYPRRERAPFWHRFDVALNRREAYLEKARAASLLFMRRCCTASTIFLLRSSE
jgi:hypothetical protein